MSVVTSMISVQASHLAEVQAIANKAGVAVYARNLGGLILNHLEVDSPDGEHLIPGCLIEGVNLVNVHGYDTVEVTVWAGGSMHAIQTDPEAEAEVRLAVEFGMGHQLPAFAECGRCGRHIVPTQPHVGC